MSGESGHSTRWMQIIFAAGIAAAFGVMISFVAEIRGEQSAMLSRFEERTIANQRTLAHISGENDRQNKQLSELVAIVTKYEAYMENIRAFSADTLEFRTQLSTFYNRLNNLESETARTTGNNLMARVRSLEDRFKDWVDQQKAHTHVDASVWNVYERMNAEEMRRRNAER